jgi:hypothetical protein
LGGAVKQLTCNNKGAKKMDHLQGSDQLEQMEKPTLNKEDLETRIKDAVPIKDAAPVSDKPEGITDVSLNKINPTDIQSPSDFADPEKYAGMRREVEMLKQMEPALKESADVETFHQWDQANQIGHYSQDKYVRGYADVFHTYHGDEAVALSSKPDGTYDVVNGRHRIAVAQEAGLQKIPARVL